MLGNSNSGGIEGSYILEGINTKEGIARFGGKQDKYFKSLLNFATNLKLEDFLSFELATNEDNYDETKKMIHTLKGVAGNLSIYSIFENARDFEKSLQENNPNKELYEDFLASLKIEKEKILNNVIPQEVTAPILAGTHVECMELLNELKQALDSLEAQACDLLVEKLRAKKWEGVSDKTLTSIYKNIENYMYDEAIEIIERI